MTSSQEHDRLVREQFRIQASAFDQQVGARGYDHVLAWIMGLLELNDSLSVLDVAAGTGLVAREIAPRVKTVVALDSTPEMLEQGRLQAATAGLANLEFEQGDAQRLPYPNSSFDLVTCRLGMHHFFDPQVQAIEMARVCRPRGQVAIIDITSTEDQAAATLHNRGTSAGPLAYPGPDRGRADPGRRAIRAGNPAQRAVGRRPKSQRLVVPDRHSGGGA